MMRMTAMIPPGPRQKIDPEQGRSRDGQLGRRKCEKPASRDEQFDVRLLTEVVVVRKVSARPKSPAMPIPLLKSGTKEAIAVDVRSARQVRGWRCSSNALRTNSWMFFLRVLQF